MNDTGSGARHTSLAVPLVPTMSDHPLLELQTDDPAGPATAFSMRSISSHEDGRQEAIAQMLPLLWGASWKVLDLMIELGLANVRPAPVPVRWPIRVKVEAANNREGTIPQLSAPARDALWAAYSATQQARHALVHRCAHIGRDGTLTPHDDHRQPLQPLTAAQQWAFCRAVRRAAEGVLAGILSPRDNEDITYNASIASGQAIPSIERRGVGLVLMNLPASRVPRCRCHPQTRRQQPVQWVDIRLRTARGDLGGPLDDVRCPIEVDPENPPPWLRRV
ncbi:MAG: hypothetical protein IPJ34_20890 [Myxococcales bacterium]|nr:hypothetical protein [Myxococcales bacterium]